MIETNTKYETWFIFASKKVIESNHLMELKYVMDSIYTIRNAPLEMVFSFYERKK